MKLNTTAAGPDTSPEPTVLLVHGLFGQARNLGVIARRLSADRRVISVDMRNHGESGWDGDHSYPAMAGDLAEVIAEHGGQMDVVGHSMGGKAAMWLALTNPALVRRLVVLDIAPVAYSHDQMGPLQAMEAVDPTTVTSRAEADAALAENLNDPGVRTFLAQSLDLRATPPRWKLNLPALRECMKTVTGWPDDTGLAAFNGPALFMHGADSDYVTAAGEAEIRRLFPAAEIEAVPGTGHWLHAEKPREVAERVAGFVG